MGETLALALTFAFGLLWFWLGLCVSFCLGFRIAAALLSRGFVRAEGRCAAEDPETVEDTDKSRIL